MGFWIFMFFMDLLIPLTMIRFGTLFIKKVPKDINNIYGYRTTMSMKNQETWTFAHHYCGRIWKITGWILAVLTVITFLPLLHKEKDIIGTYGGIICFIQMVPLIGSIYPTEKALRKTFDKNGNRR